MKQERFLAAGLLLTALIAFSLSSPTEPTRTGAVRGPQDPTIFTDSMLHHAFCLNVEREQDWRKVCTPLDQSAPRKAALGGERILAT
jgi:hypothetical protein